MKYRLRSCLWHLRRHEWLPPLHDGQRVYDYCRLCPAYRWHPQ